MSYRSDRGPTSRRTALQVRTREAWPWDTPGLAITDIPVVSPLSRLAGNGTSNFKPEDIPHFIPVSSKSSRSYSSDDARPSGLPRPAGNISSILSLGRPSTSSSAHSLPTHMSTAAASPVTPRSRNVLRRKAPFNREPANQKIAVLGTARGSSILSGTTSSSNAIQDPQPNDDSTSRSSQYIPRSRVEDPRLTRPPKAKASIRKEVSPSDRIPKEFAGLSTVVSLPPQPAPTFAPTGSPSTRYSESPGVWSSRNTTPTSLSSYSPGIVQPAKSAHRLRQPSPIQVPSSHPRSTAISPQPEESEIRHFGPQSNGASRRNLGSPEKTEKTEQGILDTDATKKRTAVTPPPRKSSMNFSSPTRGKKSDARSANDNTRPLHADSQMTSGLAVPSSSLARPSARPVRPSQHGTDKPELKPSPVIDSQMPDPTIPSSSLARPPTRPLRPSRHGTDKLELKPSPVIQSNLTTLRTTGHKRRESADKNSFFERPPDGTSVDSSQSSNSSRIPSRTAASSRLPTRPARTLTKALKETGANPVSIKRFGLFSKKSKPDLSGDKASLNDKSGRKGPAAGTGHEGYGRYAHPGRRTSVGSTSGASTRSVSTTRSGTQSASSRKGSVNSQPDLEIDDFFLDRLEPVIINGGGLAQSQLVRTQSAQSAQSGQSAGSFSIASNSTSSPVLIEAPSSFGGYSSESVGSSVEFFGQSPQSRIAASESPIAMDTEMSQREPVPVKRWPFPRPQRHEFIVVGQSDAQGSMLPVPGGGHDKTAPRHPPTAPPRARDGSNEQRDRKTDKRSKGLKWNFFHRSHTTNQKTLPLIPDAKSTTELHATVSQVPAIRPIAHYALLEPDSDSLEEILHRIEESPPNEAEPTVDTPTGLGLKKQHGESLLLPAPPASLAEYMRPSERPSSPKVFFTKDPRNTGNQERRSRLAPVGRIPRVVSSRDRDEKPTPNSLPAPPLSDTPGRYDDEYYTSGRPPLGIQTDVLPSRPFRPEPDTPKPSSAPGPDHTINLPPGPYMPGEFLTFSPRKQSRLSRSIRPEGEPILAAVSTIATQLESKTIEDEIWTEYDDLLDNMLSSETESPDNSSVPRAGEALKMVTKASKTLQAELNAAGNPRTISISSGIPAVVVAPNSARSSDSSVRLRRSMIVSALHSSISPSPQISFSDLIAGYGDGNRSSTDFPRLDASSSQGQAAQLPSLTQTASSFLTSFESSRHRNAMLFDIAERDREGAIAQTNLRSASLMTSRWLSFGRVLFSPAHNHIKSRDQERILVIDGLGNDDWSFYCALTYSNASVYSLSIRPNSSGSVHPAAWQPPANHHLIHHGSVEDPFPFPKGFFAVCILRFPSACSEAGHRNMVSECKRVLRQGGYLEMNILDLDLVNMGNRTRKAVRLLKERIYLADSDISLKPASDNIQRLLGRYGFDNLNRCMVSVPVAGMIVGSSASSHSNPSVSDPAVAVSTGRSSTSASTTDSQNLHRLPFNDAETSLGDLLSDPSPSASNDESIAKVVARVGRWWYTRCYEIPVLADGDLDRSIWADHKLLRECQKRATGIRLLIAYAQKPSERRRTVSV